MLTGLVGVRWQDVATDASIWDPDNMEERRYYEVWNDTIDFASNSVTRGDLLVGNPPLDPFLTPSIAPRTSGLAHPLSGDIMVRAESTDPLANQINGHEAH